MATEDTIIDLRRYHSLYLMMIASPGWPGLDTIDIL